MEKSHPNFQAWLERFIEVLKESGLPEPQAEKFRTQHLPGAENYWENGWTPEEAATEELLPGWGIKEK